MMEVLGGLEFKHSPNDILQICQFSYLTFFKVTKKHSLQFVMQKMFIDGHLQKSFTTGQDTCMLF